MIMIVCAVLLVASFYGVLPHLKSIQQIILKIQQKTVPTTIGGTITCKNFIVKRIYGGKSFHIRFKDKHVINIGLLNSNLDGLFRGSKAGGGCKITPTPLSKTR